MKERIETLESGYAHYWSRSRGKLWMKSETSGNVQRSKRYSLTASKRETFATQEEKPAFTIS